jgi:hypothetical protein
MSKIAFHVYIGEIAEKVRFRSNGLNLKIFFGNLCHTLFTVGS